MNAEGRTGVCAVPSNTRGRGSAGPRCVHRLACVRSPGCSLGVASRVYSPFLLAAEFHRDLTGAASERDQPLSQTFGPNPWVSDF